MFWKRRESPAADPLYAAIVAAARQPKLYAEWNVPDTLDGRFDALVLHLSLVVARLGSEGQAQSQRLIDIFCEDMDDNLREVGASDVTVGKKVRRMAEAFQGRFRAYEAAAAHDEVKAALIRNIWQGKDEPGAIHLADYVIAARYKLADQVVTEIAIGKVVFA